MRHISTPRSVFSLIDAWFVCDVAVWGNICCRSCVRRILDVITIHVPSWMMSILLSLEVWVFSRRVFCRTSSFFLQFFNTLSFRIPFKVWLMFENMIMIKRTPKKVRLSDPAMPAPPGMSSNFVNPSNLKTEGLVLVTFCLILSTLVVSMRMWTKSRVVRKVVLEDCKSTFLPSSFLKFADWIF